MKRFLDLAGTTIAGFLVAVGVSLGALYAETKSDSLYPADNFHLFTSLLLTILPATFIFWRVWSVQKNKIIQGKENLIGSKGWLLLLLITVLISTVNVWNEAGSTIGLLIGAFYLLTAISFVAKFRVTVPLLVIFLFMQFAIVLLVGAGIEVVQYGVLLLVWGVYLMKSVRVRQTLVKPLWSR